MPSENQPAVDLSTFAPEVHPETPQTERRTVRLLNHAGKTHIVVVGAGVFGGWTALELRRRGFSVTLADTWGPGHPRSSSGDETRVIRSIYGANRIYFDLTLRAFDLWTAFEKQIGRPLLHPTGALWLLYEPKDATIEAAVPLLEERNVPFARLSKLEAAKAYPLIHFSGIDHVFLEKRAGYLRARESCGAVLERFVKEGGRYLQQEVKPGKIHGGQLQSVRLSDGTTLEADAYIFACGPWMGGLFPDVIGSRITPVRQEVYYFGVPASEPAYNELPVWIDWNVQAGVYYGIPGSAGRGFKVAFDRTASPFFDPTSGERTLEPGLLDQARSFMARRFPGMKAAPLVESRVCQYPSTPDGNFLIDMHPEADNLWLLGGGSGHGFKMGPALGELVADMMTGKAPIPALFALSRLKV